MSDIYVKGWMSGVEEDVQKTDIHYRFVSLSLLLTCVFIRSFADRWMVKAISIGVSCMILHIYQLNVAFR